MSPEDLTDLLEEQVAYYRARAPEYDKWFLREGVYDLGGEFNLAWQAELAAVRDALDDFAPEGNVLDLAAGTGLWTEQVARHASHVTAVDAAPETLAINRKRLRTTSTPVEYVEADLFSWTPDRRYDAVFCGFFFTHVPTQRVEAFWSLVAAALKPGGRFFLVDNAHPFEDVVGSFLGLTTKESRVRTPWSTTDLATGTSTRRLEDGREFKIVKVYWESSELEELLRGLGWDATFATTGRFFVYGHGELRGSGDPAP